MKIIKDSLTIKDLQDMAAGLFGNLVKAVVDVEKEIIAVDAELHSDLEALLLKDGSKQDHLWGINFYPDAAGADFVEFDSMINLRPSLNNRSRGVDSSEMRERIIKIVAKKVQR